MRCKHLEDVNETYFEHMGFAWPMAWRCLKCAVALFIHGILPWFLVNYGSDTICKCYSIVASKFPHKSIDTDSERE